MKIGDLKMKRLFSFALVGALALGPAFSGNSVVYAGEGIPEEAKSGPDFVDENGDGYNDKAPDHDKGGMPNGRDSDNVKPGSEEGPRGFIDEDGDGINDLAGSHRPVENGNGFWQRIASRLGLFNRVDGQGYGNGQNRESGQNYAGGRGPGEGMRNSDQDWSGPEGRPQNGTGSQRRGASGRAGNGANSGSGDGACGGGSCPLE